MAYDTKELFNRAKELIRTQKLVFHSDVQGLLGIGISTYYDHFNKESKEYKEISMLLTENAVKIKGGLRKKWFDSNNATSQIALYKIIATDEERKKLNNVDVTTDGKEIKHQAPVMAILGAAHLMEEE